MGLRKGFFFSMDSFMALSMFVIILVSMYVFFISVKSLDQQYYISEDLFDVFSEVEINELEYSNYPYVSNLIAKGAINNTELTISEQIIEFGLNEDYQNASILIEDITGGLLPSQFGLSFELNNEIYSRGQVRTALVSRSRLLTG